MSMESKIYLDDNGNYHDNTEENRDLYPPASTTAELAQAAAPDAEPVPFTDDGRVDTDQILADELHPQGDDGNEIVSTPGPEVQTEGSGTVVESGSAETPVPTEPDTAKARTRKQ